MGRKGSDEREEDEWEEESYVRSGEKEISTWRGENMVDGRGRKGWGGIGGESEWKEGEKMEVKQGRRGREEWMIGEEGEGEREVEEGEKERRWKGL